MTDQALARMIRVGQILSLVVGITAQKPHSRLAVVAVVHIEDALLRINQRRQFRQDHLRNGFHVALALQHAGKAREVRFQPILFGVLLRGVLEIENHLVDVVFQSGHFALCFDRDRSRQVALGHGRGNLSDGPHLRRQVFGETVYVVSQVAPGSRRAGHVSLAAEFPFHAHLAGHRTHLIGERRERVGHVVDGVGQFSDFAFGFHRQFAFQIAVGNRGHHASDTAYLICQVAGHRVHVVG